MHLRLLFDGLERTQAHTTYKKKLIFLKGIFMSLLSYWQEVQKYKDFKKKRVLGDLEECSFKNMLTDDQRKAWQILLAGK